MGADLTVGLRRYSRPATGAAPKVISHRGAWDRAECFENSMRSFEKARGLGAFGIEFDVHFTKDGVPVVHHDCALDRIFKHPGVLEHMTLKEIRSVTKDLPTLEDVLALSGLHFMIEIKVPMDSARVAALGECLEQRVPTQDYHLLSIQPALVRESSKLPREAWMLVGELNLRPLVDLSLDRGYAGVAGHYLGMTNKLIARLHDKNQKAGAGFVPDKNLFNREWSRGVDFVFTNSTYRLF